MTTKGRRQLTMRPQLAIERFEQVAATPTTVLLRLTVVLATVIVAMALSDLWGPSLP